MLLAICCKVVNVVLEDESDDLKRSHLGGHTSQGLKSEYLSLPPALFFPLFIHINEPAV